VIYFTDNPVFISLGTVEKKESAFSHLPSLDVTLRPGGAHSMDKIFVSTVGLLKIYCHVNYRFDDHGRVYPHK